MLLSLLFAACMKQGNVPVQTIEVSLPASEAPAVHLSEMASSVACIPLETNDSILIGEPVQIVLQDEVVCVADHAALHKYDLSGKWLASVKRRGSGPEEYLGITDMQLDADATPWVLCRTGKALYHYSWNGDLLKKIPLAAWVERIRFLDGKMLLFAGNAKDETNAHQLMLLDLESGQVIGRRLPIDDNKAAYLHVQSPNHFCRSNGQHCFYQVFCDTLYTLSRNAEVTPCSVVNFAGKNIPPSFYAASYQDIMDFFQHLSKGDYAYGISLFLEKHDAQWLSYLYGGHVYWHVSKAGTGKSVNRLIDDVCLEGYPIELDETACFVQDDASVVFPLSPYLLMEHAGENMDAGKCRMLREKIRYAGDEQNPVLLKITM